MSIEARLDTLTERHQALEAALAEERNRASSDDLRIAELKRRKLALKDQIEDLRQTTPLQSGRRLS